MKPCSSTTQCRNDIVPLPVVQENIIHVSDKLEIQQKSEGF